MKSFFNLNKLDFIDLGLIKFSCIGFGILIAKNFPNLIESNTLIILILLFAIRPTYRFYFLK